MADAAGARPRAPLTRAAVVAAATSVVDRDGVDALTMRRLGRELGVEAMAIYHYVSGRDALLDLVSDHVVDDLFAPEVLLRDDATWQGYLRRIARGLRALAEQHPRLFSLVSTHPLAMRGLRPPLRSAHWADAFLTGLQRHGFDDAESVHTYRAVTAFLVGHLLLDINAPDAAAEETPALLADAETYPTLSRLLPLLTDHDGAQDFEDSLTHLLGTLEGQLGRAPGRATTRGRR